MFGISGEHLLVLVVILLIFGPKRLPDLGHSMGKTLKNFKDAMNGNHEQNTIQTAQTPPPKQVKAAEDATLVLPQDSSAKVAQSQPATKTESEAEKPVNHS